MITEFGAANGTECSSYVTDIINYMAENDEYIGWTAWAAGPLWGKNSPCCSDSLQWGSLEPGSTAADGSPGMYEGVWVDEIQPLLPTTLQQNGISNVNGPGGNSVSSSSSVAGCCASSITTAQSTSTSTSTSSPTTTSSGASVPLYGQCGGTGYTGFTVCASGTCKYQNAWYSQCL
jgi:endoglucanase